MCNQDDVTPTGRLTKTATARYTAMGEEAFASGMDQIDWPQHPAFAGEALTGMPCKARRKALDAFLLGWARAATPKGPDRHSARITEVSSNGGTATVELADGRVEHIIRRGMIPDFVLGALCFVAYSRTINGYAWVFVSY